MLNDVLVIEDNPSDIREVTRILQDLGVQNIHTVARIASAVDYLSDVVEGCRNAPDLIVLDLNFEDESGFEVLRFWRSTPQLKGLPIVVWTVMGELEKKIASLFGVDKVMDKSTGYAELYRFMHEHYRGGSARA